MTIDTDRPASRRAVLTAALGGAAALGVQALASAPGVRAADADPLVLGAPNTAASETSLTADRDSGTVLGVVNNTTAISKSSVGVLGSAANGVGLKGASDTNVGVYGATADETAASEFTDFTGVYGFVDGTGLDPLQFVATGVWGDSVEGIGIFGSGPSGVVGVGGWGVLGFSDVANGIGVVAEAAAPARALVVNGKAHFSRSGKVSVGRTRSSVSLSMAGVTSASMVIATVQANKIGLYVKGAVATTNKITIYLSKKPPATVRVAFIVLD
jgi:hypothetical protein